jgi:5,10-methylene-tetrahydrofolate dehydrogenase/methenyl tetrahydrofolate cyclohydrolase
MTAQIIDGKALAEELRQSFKSRVETLTAKGTSPAWWSFWSVKTRPPRFT